MAARDPKARSAWIGMFLRLTEALTETAFVGVTLERAGNSAPRVAPLPNGLRLPKLPAFPQEGTPTPSRFPQNNLRRFFQSDQRLG